MPERISKEGLHDLHNRVWWILLESIPHDLPDDEKRIFRSDDSVEVSLVMNGVELKFSQWVEHFFSLVDDMVKKEAARIVAEKLNDLGGRLSELNEAIEEAVKQKVEEQLGIRLEVDHY